MKKGILVLSVAVFGFSMVSCKKDFTCECTESGTTYSYTMKESKKAAAYAACEGKGIGSVEVGGQTVPQNNNCKIK
ncbi:MAG: hypothetical protein ACK4K0_08515 [Flavobacteriales bacterium]